MAFPRLTIAVKLYAIFALLATVTLVLAVVAVANARRHSALTDAFRASFDGARQIERVNALIYAVVMESRGIYAFDMKGTPVWQKDLGDKTMRMQFGEGSTPALFGNMLVVVWDHQGESFIVGLDKRTGEERWRTARDSW